jgi:hypothetical protein
LRSSFRAMQKMSTHATVTSVGFYHEHSGATVSKLHLAACFLHAYAWRSTQSSWRILSEPHVALCTCEPEGEPGVFRFVKLSLFPYSRDVPFKPLPHLSTDEDHVPPLRTSATHSTINTSPQWIIRDWESTSKRNPETWVGRLICAPWNAKVVWRSDASIS